MTIRTTGFIEQQHLLEQNPGVCLVTSTVDDALAAQEKIERRGGMRLTNAMRDNVLAKVLDFKFKKSGEALDRTEHRLSHKAMVTTFGKANLDALAKIGAPYAFGSVDDGGAPLTGEALDNWRGTKINWRVGNDGYTIDLHVKDPLPLMARTYGAAKYFTVKPGQLADDIIQWRADVDDWLKNRREMLTKVSTVLNSVTTFSSLQKTWPDGERFWKHLPTDFPFRNQVPAVRIEELNTALGL